jgi:hypothetical protein
VIRTRRLLRGPLAAAVIWQATVSAAPAAEVYGYVQEAIAVRTGPGDVIYHRQLLNLKTDHEPNDTMSLRFEGDFWADEPDFESAEGRARLREGYMKLRFPKADFRVGRVQIAWGEADGVIIADQVSPFDIENFIVPPFDEIRLGVDGAFLDYYPRWDRSLQAFWISHFTSPDFANRDSPWSFFGTEALLQNVPPGFNVSVDPIERPKTQPANYEWGMRFKSQAREIDWQVGYLYSFDDRPHARLRPTSLTSAVFEPRHNRFHLATGSFAVPVSVVLLRVDSALEIGRFLQLKPTAGRFNPASPRFNPDAFTNALARGFVTESNVSRSLVAVDFKPSISWWHQPDASFQFVHETVIDPNPALLQSKNQDLVSLRLQAAYLNETIKPWIFAIANVRGDDTWVQAKIDWQPRDLWRFSVEYDWFNGHEDDGKNGGTFGRFHANDMVMFQVRYSL